MQLIRWNLGRGWGWGFAFYINKENNPVLAYSKAPSGRLLMLGSHILLRPDIQDPGKSES